MVAVAMPMEPVRTSNLMLSPSVLGNFLCLCALIFYYLSVLQVDYKDSHFLDLKPGPDATEYFALAEAMHHGHKPSIRIGYERLPSAFPLGYPALMLPWLSILPRAEAVLAPFKTSQTVGLVLLVSVFIFYLYLDMPLAGGVATALLATLPGFYTFSRSSMSDASAWLFYALAAMFAYLGLKEERRWKIYLSAAILGLSMNLRLQSAFFAPLLLAMPLFPVRGGWGRWFWHCVAAATIFFLASSPFLVLNYLEFHSPLKLGGNFWYPPRKLFSLGFIPTKNIPLFWREFTLQPLGYLAANVFGTGTVFTPAFVLLVLAGIPFLRMNRALIPFICALIFFSVLTASYLYPDGRYYLQLLIFLIPLAVLPVVRAARNVFRRKRSVAACGIFLLFLATCLGFPSRSGYQLSSTKRFQSWDALHFHSGRTASPWHVAEQEFAAASQHQPGIVLSDIDPVYLNALLPDSFAAAPIDENQLRRWSPVWHYGKTEASALVESGLQKSIPVYALVVPPKESDSVIARLPKPAGYKWSTIQSGTTEKILKLTPTGS